MEKRRGDSGPDSRSSKRAQRPPASWWIQLTISRALDTTDDIAGADVNGERSLRWAIGQLNASQDASNEIVFGAGPTFNLQSELPAIEKNVTIDDSVVIRRAIGGANMRVLVIMNGFVDLSNLEIANGLAASGGGLYIGENATVNMYNCIVTGNAATGDGGGIYNLGGLYLRDSTVAFNDASGNGGGIYNGGDLTIEYTGSIDSNRSLFGSGGGVHNDADGSAELTSTTFTQNTASEYGGGLYAQEFGTVTSDNCTFEYNQAARGGGIAVSGGLSLTGGAIRNNWAGDGGGFYNLSFLEITISDCTIENNEATGSATGTQALGGGIYNQGVLVVTDSWITNNWAGDGGGLYCSGDSSTSLVSVDLFYNLATRPGEDKGRGGGFYRASGTLSLTGCTVSDNDADDPLSIGGLVQAGPGYTTQDCFIFDPVLEE